MSERVTVQGKKVSKALKSAPGLVVIFVKKADLVAR
jgi:hypothetical protein